MQFKKYLILSVLFAAFTGYTKRAILTIYLSRLFPFISSCLMVLFVGVEDYLPSVGDPGLGIDK